MVHEALPARGPLQEVVDPALDVAAAQQGLAEAIDGEPGVEADGGPRAVGVHQHHLVLEALRPLRLRGAARRRLPALGVGERGVVGVGGVLGQLQRRGLLAERQTAFPGQRQPTQAPALLLARGGAGGHGWGSSGGAAVSGLRCHGELRTGAGRPLPPPLAWPPRGRLRPGKVRGSRGGGGAARPAVPVPPSGRRCAALR